MGFAAANSIEINIIKKKLPKMQKHKSKMDDMFFRYANEKYPELEAQRIREGFYQLGTNKIHTIEKNGIVLVRIGGGFATMEKFFENLHVKEQAIRLQHEHMRTSTEFSAAPEGGRRSGGAKKGKKGKKKKKQ
eukprot:CAMPEP_0176368566 /NCGR_PEP_ID=MMETSP0126-20121128/22685_1 /TAXON_ID=141414 ORGANISM="Strombidinopsis acuminatum, Strain SPMC142" /NCGR_SAMPLE_ID=MMETSP0126 /ASSEMBLY_ACC=CAM_ASM_000229 /LENGTH=132 /DNA_ID=CAMNT_0017726869 /DNA_START=1408 /DNA_END=1806 /DNA_ORIENTATION=-